LPSLFACPKSSVTIVFVEPLPIPTLPAIYRMVKRWSSTIIICTLSMTSVFWLVDGLLKCWSLSVNMRPSLKQLTLFTLNDPHCIICKPAEFCGLLSLSILKFLTKLDAISLLQAFCHLEQNENATNMCYTTLVSGSDRCIQRCFEAAKNHACAWKSLLPPRLVSPTFRHFLPREKI
jgi:hypothetical protein